jgi:N-acetylmuramoyl-L-alanine amidase
MTNFIDPDSLKFVNSTFKPCFIVIHHSLTKDGDVVDWSAIRRYHKETNGWGDVGYHFGVERVNGEYHVLEGRSMMRQGAHVKNFNNISLGICMVGNFDKEPVPVEQWNLTLKLVKRLQWFLHIPSERVLGHWEAQAHMNVPENQRKSCPGLLCNMDSFREDLTRVI